MAKGRKSPPNGAQLGIEETIRLLARKHGSQLKAAIDKRLDEMRDDDRSHFLAIVDAGHTPIRVMFYYPNRAQAIKIQQTLETLYHGVRGEYYYGERAWQFVEHRTGVDLLKILRTLARENAPHG